MMAMALGHILAIYSIVWRSYLARGRTLLSVVLHFWHWNNRNTNGALVFFSSLMTLFLVAVQKYTRRRSRLAGH